MSVVESKRRRSSRRRVAKETNNSVYVDQHGSSDDEKLAAFFGDAHSSGSDFEQDVIQKSKKDVGMKQKSKFSISSSSSSSAAEEEEEDMSDEPLVEEPVKNKKKKVIDKSAEKEFKTREALLKLSSVHKMKACKRKSPNFSLLQKSPSSLVGKSKLSTGASCSLALSESSSSDNEDDESRASSSVPIAVKKAKRRKTPLKAKKEEEESKIHFASQLESLAMNYGNDLKAINQMTRIKPVPKDQEDIAHILAQGEGIDMHNLSSEEEEERSESHHHGSIEIAVDVPGQLRRKQKKEFDMAAYLKRQLSKAQREIQMTVHQTHVLCLLGHLRHINTYLCFPPTNHWSAQLSLATALSIVPKAHVCSSRELTLVRLKATLTWFRTAMPIVPSTVGEDPFPHPLNEWIMKALENYICVSHAQRVLIFVLCCRALGWPTRLVLNLDTVPMKPVKTLASKLSESAQKKAKHGDHKKKAKPSSDKYEEEEKESHVKKSKDTKGKSKRSDKPSSTTIIKRSTKVEKDATKRQRSSKNSTTKGKAKSQSLSENALKEIEKRKVSNQRKSEYFRRRQDSDSNSDDFEQQSSVKKKPTTTPKKMPSKGGKKKSSSAPVKSRHVYWCEVYVMNSGWVTVDVDSGKVNCAEEMEERCGVKPMLYVIAINSDGSLKDVTRRYGSTHYHTHTRKSRAPTEDWLAETLLPWERKGPTRPIDEEEDKQLSQLAASAPMPVSVGAFKAHPLYALKRHLLKFEAIYPPEAPTLGFIKSEAVYARECVHTLHCRVTWLKEGRVVRIGEEPYKVVKARPKWDKMSGNVIKDQPLEVFGRWQTETYVPPPAVDGKVPRNEYGNVELFKPWMLPKGTVHLPINGLNRVAKKLNIDCAAAMVGWEFSGGGCHPVFDGFVVCEEFGDILMDAWNTDVEERERKAVEKKTKKALDNWRKLIRGMLMHEKIRKKYAKKD